MYQRETYLIVFLLIPTILAIVKDRNATIATSVSNVGPLMSEKLA